MESHALDTKPGGPRERRSARDGLCSRLRVRSVAGQVFLWLLVVVVLLVAAALTALILQARNYATSDAEHRTHAAAIILAHYPGAAAALDPPIPLRRCSHWPWT
ncbi:hypothetical protein GCM10010430_22080 [Kitasatospora cystarginea]|uniref:Uncharacterized protein n=1 Tax=Kitasatospora cystarginea TaxID=58350 RepID=A0ABP5QMG5_9ACTN